MTTYERRNYLNLFLDETNKREEQLETLQNKPVGGRGSRTTKISGDALKSKLKSGEIPNQ